MAETEYNEMFPEQAMNWASDGLSDAQIAQRMSISRSSFYNYRQQYPEFAGAIEAGRDVVDGRVETTLLDLALGNYMITTYVTDDEGRTRTTVRKAAPNLKAIQYWLERSDKRKETRPAPLHPDCGVKKEAESAGGKSVSVFSAMKTPPDLDPSEAAGLKSLAEYKAMYPADAGDGFSKKETQEFEDMMLVTFTEMERRKYKEKAIAEGRPQIPYTDDAPRTLKGKYAPDMIKAWKDRADFFALAV